jgi:tetratricopeptide (TPR) repeat protein
MKALASMAVLMSLRILTVVASAVIAAGMSFPGCRANPAAGGTIVVTHTPETQKRWEVLEDERPPASPEPDEDEKLSEKGRALLRAGRVDEARAAYGLHSWLMEHDLRALAKEAAEKGQNAQALALYGMLLGSRECLLWRQLCSSWMEVDAEYLALIMKMPAKELDEPARQDLAFMDLYSRARVLIDARRFDEAEERRELYEIADACLAKYPKARLALTAMLAASCAAQGERPAEGGSPSAPGIRKTDELLARMRASGMSRYSLDVVLTNLVCWTADLEGDRDLLVRARKASEEIAREGEPRSRPGALLDAATCALQAREEDGRLARRLYAEALSLYPQPPWDAYARAGIVRTWLDIEGPEAALAALRDLEKQAPAGTDFSRALFEVACAYQQAGRPDRAVVVLEEIVRRHPGGMTAARALRQTSKVWREAGDETKMIAALRDAAALLPADRPMTLEDGCVRSFACEDLADYYIAKKDWAEALKWSQAWKPQTGCANCDVADRWQRRGYIALAQAALGRSDEALKMMEKVDDWEMLGRAAVMLVDTCAERGALAELVPKLEAAAQSDRGEGARIALRYVELLRLKQARDVAALWKTMDEEGLPFSELKWLEEEVPALVAELGGPAREFFMDEVARGTRHEDEAVTALARMKSPEVLRLLVGRAKRETGESSLRKTLTALAIFGTDEAYAVIREVEQAGSEEQKNVAREVLWEHPRR